MSGRGTVGLPGRKAQVVALIRRQRLAEALSACRQLCGDQPGDAGNWFMLADIHGQLGQYAAAIQAYDAVLQHQPGHLQAWYNRGVMLEGAGIPAQAAPCYRKALDIRPDFAPAWFSLANLAYRDGDIDEAERCYRQAITHQPGLLAAQANLGKLLQAARRHTEAARHLRAALVHCPDNAELYNDLGMSLSVLGHAGEAEQAFRKALSCEPEFHVAGGNLLLTLNYTGCLSAREEFSEHLHQGRRIARGIVARTEFPNSAEPERALRIGYLSADFREHSVAYFIAPLLESRDRNNFAVTCYANVERPDSTTRRLQGLADQWRDISGMPDDQVAKLISADRIDILVDLGGHTAGNRLPVFAARPAPLQVTYLGYPNTTGLETMDYRLTDERSDPPGVTDACYTESLVRLPGCFLCYAPPADAPLPAACPAGADGRVTFGSFNNYGKITEDVVECWAAVIQAVPGSRLLLKNFSLSDPEVRAACVERFARHGISGDRLALYGVVESRKAHLALYGQVDIALDTFPYNGTTTTCEALWMGVPVITLAGERHAGRVGVSLLSAVGLESLVARDRRSFIELAATLAGNSRQREHWRSTLRDTVRASTLCAGSDFARKVERACRDMWVQYCARVDG